VHVHLVLLSLPCLLGLDVAPFCTGAAMIPTPEMQMAEERICEGDWLLELDPTIALVWQPQPLQK